MLSKRQKCATSRNGLRENVLFLRSSRPDFLLSSSTLCIAVFDINDATGSSGNEIMISELPGTGYPRAFVEITEDIYGNSTFQVKTASGLTKPTQRGKGIIQRRLWSAIEFEQGVD